MYREVLDVEDHANEDLPGVGADDDDDDDDDDDHADDDADLPSVCATTVCISPGQGLNTLLNAAQTRRWLETNRLAISTRNWELQKYGNVVKLTPSCDAEISCDNAMLGKNKINICFIIICLRDLHTNFSMDVSITHQTLHFYTL